MARTTRHSPTGWYHVTNRGVDRQPIVRDDRDRRSFFRSLAKALSPEVRVHQFCLMTNHFHLLLRADGPGELSRTMQRLTTSYSRTFNQRHQRTGPVFTGRFHDVPIETDAQLLAAMRYIALNPTAIRGADIATFPWSSHRYLLGADPAPSWFDVGLSSWFGGPTEYREFVEAGRDDIEMLHATIRLVCDELFIGCSRRRGDVRDVTLNVADRLAGGRGVELADAVLPPGPEAARTARSRARTRLQDATVATAVARVLLTCRTSSVTAEP